MEMLRRGFRVIRRLPPSAVFVPTTCLYQYYSLSATAAGSAPQYGDSGSISSSGGNSGATRLRGLPAELTGAHAWAISSSSYPANDPIEDRWMVSRLTLPPTSHSSSSQSSGSSSKFGSTIAALTGSQSTSSVVDGSASSVLLAAVMDGHGGWQASDFVQQNIGPVLQRELAHNADNNDPEKLAAALSRTFERLDREFISRVRPAFEIGFGEVARVGCCAVAAIVTPQHVIVANAGDCRAVFGRATSVPGGSASAGDAFSIETGSGADDSVQTVASSSVGSINKLSYGSSGRMSTTPVHAFSDATSLVGFSASNRNSISSAGHHFSTFNAVGADSSAIVDEEERRMNADIAKVQQAQLARLKDEGGIDCSAASASPIITGAPAHRRNSGAIDSLLSILSGIVNGKGASESSSSAFEIDLTKKRSGSLSSPVSGALAFSPYSAEDSTPTRSSSSGGPALKIEAVPLSDDHNARMPREQAALRLMHPGEEDVVYLKPGTSAWYVKARLQPTRAIGDAYLKHSEFNGPPGQRLRGRHVPPPYTPPYITSRPETRILKLPPEVAGGGSSVAASGGRTRSGSGASTVSAASSVSFASSGSSVSSPTISLDSPSSSASASSSGSSDHFLILACDGVWDVMTNAEAVRFVAEDRGDPATVADRLVTRVLEMEAALAHMDLAQLQSVPPGRRRRGLHDDLTAVVVRLGASCPPHLSHFSSPSTSNGVSRPGNGDRGLWSTVTGWLGLGGGGTAAGAGKR